MNGLLNSSQPIAPTASAHSRLKTSWWHRSRTFWTLTPAVLISSLLLFHFLLTSISQAQLQDNWQEEALQAREELVETANFMYPSEFGIQLPDGEPERYPWKHVLTIDEQGKGCVGKVHAKVGDNFLVMLPNGSIAPRMEKDVEPTEREFTTLTAEEIAEEVLRDPRLRGFKSKITKNHVFIYNTTESFTTVASRLMRSMIDGVGWYARDQGLPVHRPPAPLVVIMFNKERQFLSYQRVPPGVFAYYDMISNHVVLHEDSGLASFSRELARQELLATIAHEGAHQILYNIGVQQRLSGWPMWLGEGLAEYLAPTKASQNYKWKGTGRINDMRMWELEMFLQKQHIKGFNGETLDWVVKAPSLDSTGYATAWSVTHFLAETRKDQFAAYLRYLSQLPPLFGVREGIKDQEVALNVEHFQRFFGADFEAVENDLVSHMVQQKYDSPVEGMRHLVGMATISKLGEAERKHACFYIDQQFVTEWQQAVLSSLPESERRFISFEVATFPNREKANKHIKKWMKEE